MTSTMAGFLGESGTLGFYHSSRLAMKLFPFMAPLLFFIDAPHGRAANPLGLNVNGNVAWLLMELVSPITCLLAACSDPFESTPNSMLLPSFQNFDIHRIRALPPARLSLLLAFLLHYLHRSLISTLRNPGRSPMHVSVPISAMVFNLLNGYLIGSWLSGRCLSVPHNPVHTPSSSLGWAWAQFSLYMVGWALGFGSNIAHDELLSRLRRSSTSKARYSVPHGLLYSSPFGGISCPHYLSELFEWLTFAGAASIAVHQLEQTSSVCDHDLFNSPPGLFFLAMVAVLVPRAIRTHKCIKPMMASNDSSGVFERFQHTHQITTCNNQLAREFRATYTVNINKIEVSHL